MQQCMGATLVTPSPFTIRPHTTELAGYQQVLFLLLTGSNKKKKKKKEIMIDEGELASFALFPRNHGCGAAPVWVSLGYRRGRESQRGPTELRFHGYGHVGSRATQRPRRLQAHHLFPSPERRFTVN